MEVAEQAGPCDPAPRGVSGARGFIAIEHHGEGADGVAERHPLPTVGSRPEDRQGEVRIGFAPPERGESDVSEDPHLVHAQRLRARWSNHAGLPSDLVLSGEVALPAGDMGEPFVDADDIADVAVAALTDDRHIGELYELTGPRLLTFAQAIDEIATASGRDVRYVPLAMDDFVSGMAAQNVPGEVIGALRYLFSEVLDGRNAHLTDGVQRALGREPKDFSDFARDAADAGAWSV